MLISDLIRMLEDLRTNIGDLKLVEEKFHPGSGQYEDCEDLGEVFEAVQLEGRPCLLVK